MAAQSSLAKTIRIALLRLPRARRGGGVPGEGFQALPAAPQLHRDRAGGIFRENERQIVAAGPEPVHSDGIIPVEIAKFVFQQIPAPMRSLSRRESTRP